MDATEFLFSLILHNVEAAGQPPARGVIKPLKQSSPCRAGGNGLMSCPPAQPPRSGHTPLPWTLPSPNPSPPDPSPAASGNSWTLTAVLSVNWRGETDGQDTTSNGWTTHQLREVFSNQETLKTSPQEKEKCHN